MKHLQLYEGFAREYQAEWKAAKDKMFHMIGRTHKAIWERVHELLAGQPPTRMIKVNLPHDRKLHAVEKTEHGRVMWEVVGVRLQVMATPAEKERLDPQMLKNKTYAVLVCTTNRGEEIEKPHTMLSEDDLFELLAYLESLGTQEEWLAKEEGGEMGFFLRENRRHVHGRPRDWNAYDYLEDLLTPDKSITFEPPLLIPDGTPDFYLHRLWRREINVGVSSYHYVYARYEDIGAKNGIEEGSVFNWHDLTIEKIVQTIKEQRPDVLEGLEMGFFDLR